MPIQVDGGGAIGFRQEPTDSAKPIETRLQPPAAANSVWEAVRAIGEPPKYSWIQCKTNELWLPVRARSRSRTIFFSPTTVLFARPFPASPFCCCFAGRFALLRCHQLPCSLWSTLTVLCLFLKLHCCVLLCLLCLAVSAVSAVSTQTKFMDPVDAPPEEPGFAHSGYFQVDGGGAIGFRAEPIDAAKALDATVQVRRALHGVIQCGTTTDGG